MIEILDAPNSEAAAMSLVCLRLTPCPQFCPAAKCYESCW